MDRPQLLQHFDTLAETPEALTKLRTLVLDLAVRGRLVPQTSEPDKDAAWQKFCQELEERDHNPESLSPFEIPDGWRWAVLERLRSRADRKIPLSGSPMLMWEPSTTRVESLRPAFRF